jgi:hypothetical protein
MRFQSGGIYLTPHRTADAVARMLTRTSSTERPEVR